MFQGGAKITIAVIVIVFLFAVSFSGFSVPEKGGPESTKTYRVVEGMPVEGKNSLNIVELPLTEYHTPTPIPPPPPPPPIEIPSPTEGPTPTPAPTRPPTPTPTVGPLPTAVPTSPPPPPPPPPEYVPGFLDSIIQFFLK